MNQMIEQQITYHTNRIIEAAEMTDYYIANQFGADVIDASSTRMIHHMIALDWWINERSVRYED